MELSDAEVEQLKSVLKQIMPVGARGRLAVQGNVDMRVASRWMTGEKRMPDDVVDWLRAQFAAAQAARPAEAVAALVEDLRARGVDDLVIGSHLADAIERLKNN
ncbi:hypothetical protein IHQ68_04860 [Chelatococcus sambhunathii]|uniref:Uncharacterized protein n=1 Tax=Chelatococcus sambhunathii TaxID=363953 RepID=A0ABU1DCW4_9HYPH|nr:hypothetical protein [Chelatococcus sambhunathii]MDR4305955.1 hypothetical protein [Chelatococcus sambhunathii]